MGSNYIKQSLMCDFIISIFVAVLISWLAFGYFESKTIDECKNQEGVGEYKRVSGLIYCKTKYDDWQKLRVER